MNPTLLILAAGMGSRYGGLKQLDGVGPNGETIMDYSVYDAVKAGFDKVVFVVRGHFKDEFKQKVASKYDKIIKVEFVEQELDKLPEGFELNPDRVKPWGTGHAMLMAADVIDAPFAVINADDYYGQESFKVLGDYLKQVDNNSTDYCMVGFYLDKTLSESGGVSRGVCTVDSENFLTTVEEHHHIENKNGNITGEGMSGEVKELDGNAYVSMNMWGFTPTVFKSSKDLFVEFLNNNKENITKEFYIPYVVNNGIEKKESSVKVLSTPDKWFGVTYKEDRPIVVNKLKELSEIGVYPSPLFK